MNFNEVRPCSAAQTGNGYWTCDVVGGCRDCRSLARDAEDDYVLAEWDVDFRATYAS